MVKITEKNHIKRN